MERLCHRAQLMSWQLPVLYLCSKFSRFLSLAPEGAVVAEIYPLQGGDRKETFRGQSVPLLIALLIQWLSRKSAQIKENLGSKHSWGSIQVSLVEGYFFFSFVSPLFLPFQNPFFPPLWHFRNSHIKVKKNPKNTQWRWAGQNALPKLCLLICFKPWQVAVSWHPYMWK